MPNSDLFVFTKQDVKNKLKLKRTKGYFNEPQDLAGALRPSPIKHKDKKSNKPNFSNHNLAVLRHKGLGTGSFSDSVSITRHLHKDTNKKGNFTEFQASGLTDTSLISAKSPKNENLDDPNYELNNILRKIGFAGIKEYQSSSIWRSRGKKKINPLFIKTKDTKKLKFLQRQLLLMQREAKTGIEEAKNHELNSFEKKQFYKTVNKMVEQSPKNSTQRVFRKQVFTPESALSTLPSLQIVTVNPSESASKGIKRYREKVKIKTKLEKNRLKFSNSAQPQFIKIKDNQTVGKLDISLSSRADECRERMIKSSHSIKDKNAPNSYRKQTVYSSRQSQSKMRSDLQNEISKTQTVSSNGMKMYPIHPISITATNDDLKISITHGSTKVEIPKDVNQKFNSRN